MRVMVRSSSGNTSHITRKAENKMSSLHEKILG
jgi:hypothetical protein